MATTANGFQTKHEPSRLAEEAGVEYVGGHFLEKTLTIRSARVEAAIIALLHSEASRAGGASVFGPVLGYKVFTDDRERFRKPDVSVVRDDRLKGIDEGEGFMRIPADLVVEVVSPGDLSYDVNAKVEEYLRHGFKTVWVVHPNTKTVAVHRLGGAVSVLRENDEITVECLPTFRRRVGEFFQGLE